MRLSYSKISLAISSLSAALMLVFCRINTYAISISPNITVEEFNNMTGENISGTLLGTVFWILRIMGVLLIMWGVYGLVTAKKDGDADSINVAMTKLIFGIVFLTMPTILSAMNIITVPAGIGGGSR